MNSKQALVSVLCMVFLVFGCTVPKGTNITNVQDYDQYLNSPENKTLERTKRNEQFWTKKLEQTPNQFPYLRKLAAIYTDYFSATGKIHYLKKAEEQLLKVNEKTNYENPSYLKALAHNYITQHRFKEALQLLGKAEQLGEKLQETRKMLFDVYLELGNYEQAHAYLKTFENFSDFDYLIRLSKWSDHKGQLDAAITYMEKAVLIAESSNLDNLKQWSYTNIADFYGHAGDIEKSYRHYLKALALDPNDPYAKKGIAWIVYSHEKNPVEALRILNKVTETYHAPDYYLLKAEVADYLNFEAIHEQALNSYRTEMTDSAYGDMYNKYNVLLFADENKNLNDAIAIAKREVDNRPTPQSYDLLAWAYFKNGNLGAALEIVDTHIVNQTYEPETLYHIAEIYKAAGKTKQIQPLKKELLASIYELGPTMVEKINQL